MNIIKSTRSLIAFFLLSAWASIPLAGPITDTVTVDGQEWAQVDLFSGLSWAEINDACPAGTCGPGLLNGFDMNGWQWASTNDVNALFNFYIGSPDLGPGSDYYSETGGFVLDNFAVRFFSAASGWRPTIQVNGIPAVMEISGAVSDTDQHIGALGRVTVPGVNTSIASTSEIPLNFTNVGGWFFRSEPSAIPNSPSIALLLLGLMLLLITHHWHKVLP